MAGLSPQQHKILAGLEGEFSAAGAFDEEDGAGDTMTVDERPRFELGPSDPNPITRASELLDLLIDARESDMVTPEQFAIVMSVAGVAMDTGDDRAQEAFLAERISYEQLGRTAVAVISIGGQDLE